MLSDQKQYNDGYDYVMNKKHRKHKDQKKLEANKEDISSNKRSNGDRKSNGWDLLQKLLWKLKELFSLLD